MSLNNYAIHRIWYSFAILLILSFNAAAQNWSWKDFSPANSGWRILAPGPFQPDSEAQRRDGNKGSYIYNDSQGFFAIIYQQYSKWDWFTQKSRFNKQRDMVIKANNGKLVKDVEINNRGMVGREVEVKFAAGSLTQIEGPNVTKYRVQRFRMFFQGKKFFIVLAVLPENEVNKPEIDNFLNSFKVNSEPKAAGNSYATDEDTTLTVGGANGILANDTDADDDKLSVSLSRPVSAPANGTLSLNADGSFTYQPKPNFSGTDTFTYKASDGVVDSDLATVTISVKPVNDAPAIANVPASLTIDELAPVRFNAVGSDIDNSPGSLRFRLSGAPQGAEINPQTGAFSFTPSEAQGPHNYSFNVSVSDGQAEATAPVSLTVNEVNVGPTLTALPSGVISELEAFNFTARANDPDIPAQTLSYSLRGAPAGVSIDRNTGLIKWTPTEAEGDGSAYKFTVSVSDGIVTNEETVSLVVREINSAPALSPIGDKVVNELEPLSIRLAASDNDLPGNSITYQLEGNRPAGLSIDPKTGEISWNPNEEQGAGEYAITVRAVDNGTPQLSDTKSFKIKVNEVNSAPKLAPLADQTVNEESEISFSVSAADTDIPKNELRYSLIDGPKGAILDPASGKFSWKPDETQGPGTFSMKFRVTDSGSPELSDETNVTITVAEVNVAPVASDGVVSTDEDSSVSINLSATDRDLPANTLSYSIVGAPANGTVTGTGANLKYTPKPDFNGTDTITFKVNDGKVDSNIARIRVDVRPVNDLPVANSDETATDQNVPIAIRVLDNDRDIDGDRLSVRIVGTPNGGKAEVSDGVIRFTPAQDFAGNAELEYEVNDNNGGTARAKVLITVRAAKPNQGNR